MPLAQISTPLRSFPRFAPYPTAGTKKKDTYILHHKAGVTALSHEAPLEPEFGVELAVLPVQLLFQLVARLKIKQKAHQYLIEAM